MITRIDTKNTVDYSVLFDKASRHLGFAEEDSITTLEEYFMNLPELIGYEDSTTEFYDIVHSAGRRFTMLPLDEDRFVIDANTRQITVPNDFKKNGIAVQGDELSEVVYFEIDRFFDATDLDTCDIYIQWEAANGDQGASVPWVIDIERKPNKIIFGWVLSSEITKVAGTIKFAVRFYKWTDSEKTTLSYSLSTLTATANIKPALNFDLGNGMLNKDFGVDTIIRNRISNMETQGTEGVPAAEAEFIIDLEKEVNLSDELTWINEAGVEEPGAARLLAQARSTDGGFVTYIWYEVMDDLGNAEKLKPENYRTFYEKTEDTEEQIRKDIADGKENIYYIQEKQGENVRYVPIVIKNEIDNADFATMLGNLYERYTECFVGATGTYKAVAINKKGSKKAFANSGYCVVPTPLDPIITTDLNPMYILQMTEGTEEVDPEVIPQVLTVALDPEGGDKAYKWYRSQVLNASEEEDFVLLEGENEPTLSVSDFGKYYAVVSNIRNKHEIPKDSAVAKVTFEVEPLTITYPETKKSFYKSDILSNLGGLGNAVRVDLVDDELNNQYYSEKVSFQWYITTDGVIDESDVEVSEAEGGKTRMLVPNQIGNYYCKVTNYLNGTQVDNYSNIITVS